jgi:hypothetical protein
VAKITFDALYDEALAKALSGERVPTLKELRRPPPVKH